MTEDAAQGFSRRNFIKGVVAAGAVASSSAPSLPTARGRTVVPSKASRIRQPAS